MKNPLPINIRCVCVEEYVKMQELHEWYRKQKSEGEILSVYTGADESLRGRYTAVDALLDKRVRNTSELLKELETKLKQDATVIKDEEVIAAHGNSDGTVTMVYRPEGSQAVDLPEKPLDLDEARAIGSAYAEQEEDLPCAEEPVPDSMWREEPAPKEPAADFTPATEPSNFFDSKFEDPVIPETEAEAEFIDDPTTAGF